MRNETMLEMTGSHRVPLQLESSVLQLQEVISLRTLESSRRSVVNEDRDSFGGFSKTKRLRPRETMTSSFEMSRHY